MPTIWICSIESKREARQRCTRSYSLDTNKIVIRMLHPRSRRYSTTRDDEEIQDARSLLNVRCRVKATIIVTEIYVGTKPNIQCKVNDVTVLKKTQRLR